MEGIDVLQLSAVLGVLDNCVKAQETGGGDSVCACTCLCVHKYECVCLFMSIESRDSYTLEKYFATELYPNTSL